MTSNAAHDSRTCAREWLLVVLTFGVSACAPAIGPLLEVLRSGENRGREVAAWALGKPAQEGHGERVVAGLGPVVGPKVSRRSPCATMRALRRWRPTL